MAWAGEYEVRDVSEQTAKTMDRPYDNIPRQGEHLTDPIDSEPTTNVRAQQPVRPLDKSKETQGVFVLSQHKERGLYRLSKLPKERADEQMEGYEEVARVPEGGDMGGLFERIPDLSEHAVFENTDSGKRYYDAEKRLRTTWAEEGKFDRVTYFTDKDEATQYAEAVKESGSAK